MHVKLRDRSRIIIYFRTKPRAGGSLNMLDLILLGLGLGLFLLSVGYASVCDRL